MASQAKTQREVCACRARSTFNVIWSVWWNVFVVDWSDLSDMIVVGHKEGCVRATPMWLWGEDVAVKISEALHEKHTLEMVQTCKKCIFATFLIGWKIGHGLLWMIHYGSLMSFPVTDWHSPPPPNPVMLSFLFLIALFLFSSQFVTLIPSSHPALFQLHVVQWIGYGFHFL